MLLEALIGFAIFIITWIVNRVVKKTNGKIKPQWIVAVLVLIAGGLYYYIEKSNPELIGQLSEFMVGSFVVSQAFYLFWLNNNKKGEQ